MTGWLANALIAVLLLPPVFVIVPALQKTYGVGSEVTLLWWIVGTAAGIVYWSYTQGQLSLLVASPRTVLAVTILGLTAGAGANIALFRAVSVAPNPGIALAIVNANCVIVYFATVSLAVVLPRYFSAAQLSWQHLLGVLFIAAGIALVLMKK